MKPSPPIAASRIAVASTDVAIALEPYVERVVDVIQRELNITQVRISDLSSLRDFVSASDWAGRRQLFQAVRDQLQVDVTPDMPDALIVTIAAMLRDKEQGESVKS